MKTKIFQSLLIGFFLMSAGYAQQNNYARKMEVTIVATENFEESRQTLIKTCADSNFILITQKEIKNGSQPATFDLELRTDEAGYQKVDQMLEKLGHISQKNAMLSNNILKGDTTSMKLIIEQNNNLIFQLTEKIATSENLKDILTKITDLQEINKKTEYDLVCIRLGKIFQHTIIIHLTE